jgi:hypothetical protein
MSGRGGKAAGSTALNKQLHTDAEFAVDTSFEKELSLREKNKLANAMRCSAHSCIVLLT